MRLTVTHLMAQYAPKTPLKPETFTMLLPGISPRATSLTQDLLAQNHRKYHIFFNERKFHNHLTHQLMAAYALGADCKRLQEIYDKQAEIQKELTGISDSLTRENYKEKLGERSSYESFLKFFEKEIEKHGMEDTVRRWVWSDGMLARTLGGVYHPLIHIGYGFEFELTSMVAQGLAMAACTTLELRPVIPNQKPLNTSYLVPVQAANAAATATQSAQDLVSRMTSQFRSSMRLGAATTAQAATSGNHNTLLDLVLEMQKDDVFKDVVSFKDEDPTDTVLKSDKAVKQINTYVSRWSIEETAHETQACLQELYWVSLLLCAATGIREKGVKLDFLLMHGLTSVSYVHHFLPHVSPSEAASLLRAHLATTLVYYVSRGRPSLQLKLLLDYKSQTNSGDNDREAWNKVLDLSIQAEEPHIVKVVRACALGQVLYGHSQDPQQEQAWLKAAQLVVDQNGDWHFEGIGFEEAWK